MKTRTRIIFILLILFIASSIVKAQVLINSVTADTFISEITQTASFNGNRIKTKKVSNNNVLMLRHLHENTFSENDESNYFGKFESLEVAKYALNGTKIWKKNYSLVSGLISDFVETPDNGFMLVGIIESNISIIKLDSTGNIVFRQNYPTSSNMESVEKIAATNDGNYLVITNIDSILGHQICGFSSLCYDIHTAAFVTKINANGNIIWKKQLTNNYLRYSNSGYNSSTYPTIIDVLDDGSNTVNLIKNYVPDFDSAQILKLYHLDANGNILDEHLIGNYSCTNSLWCSIYTNSAHVTESGYTNTSMISLSEIKSVFYDKSGVLLDSDTLVIADAGSSSFINRYLDLNSPSNNENYIFPFKGKYYHGTRGNNAFILDKSDRKFDVEWANLYQENEGNTPEGIYLAALDDSTLLAVINSLRGDPTADLYADLQFKIISLNSNQIDYTCFIDKNQNLILDSLDIVDIDASIELSNNSNTELLVPSAGRYLKYAPSGNYTSKLISYNQTLKYYNVDPVSTNTIFPSDTRGIDTIIFRLTPKPNIQDLQVSIVPTIGARPGFNSSYKIITKNVGTKMMYLPMVKFIKDSLQTFTDSTTYAFDADTLFWQIDSLSLLEQREIIVSVLNAIPPTLNANDTLHLAAVIYPIENDSFPADNYASLNQVVVNSVDPNDKIETHGGTIPYSAVQNRDYLYYTIRFQNTGNSYATRIVITDTLTENVDASTLEFLSSSVPFVMNVVDRKHITWTAANTYLPDSIADEANSHGYISFRIKPKAGLLPSDEITNRASIVFDYNAAILTNTCTTNIIEQRILSVKNNEIKPIYLFPNPTNGNVQLNMNLLQNKNYTLRIIDINGNLLSNQNINGNAGENNVSIDLSTYANGLYFIQVSDETGNLFYGKVVKQ